MSVGSFGHANNNFIIRQTWNNLAINTVSGGCSTAQKQLHYIMIPVPVCQTGKPEVVHVGIEMRLLIMRKRPLQNEGTASSHQ